MKNITLPSNNYFFEGPRVSKKQLKRIQNVIKKQLGCLLNFGSMLGAIWGPCWQVVRQKSKNEKRKGGGPFSMFFRSRRPKRPPEPIWDRLGSDLGRCSIEFGTILKRFGGISIRRNIARVCF